MESGAERRWGANTPVGGRRPRGKLEEEGDEEVEGLVKGEVRMQVQVQAQIRVLRSVQVQVQAQIPVLRSYQAQVQAQVRKLVRGRMQAQVPRSRLLSSMDRKGSVLDLLNVRSRKRMMLQAKNPHSDRCDD